MPESDYTREPPTASAIQLAAISDKINTICGALEKLQMTPQQLDRLSMQIEQMKVDQQQTREMLNQTKSGLVGDIEKINKDLDVLKTSKTKLDTVTNIVSAVGVTFIIAVMAAWTTQKTRIENNTALSTANEQRLRVLESASEKQLSIAEREHLSLRTQMDAIRESMYRRGYKDEK